MDLAHLGEIVAELGATGVLVVVFAYTFIKVLPKRDAAFLGALQAQRDDYRNERELDRAEMREDRDAHQNEIERILKANGHGG